MSEMTEFFRVVSDWNKQLTSTQLINVYSKKDELLFSRNGKTFCEIFTGSETVLPYITLGYNYEVVISQKSVNKLLQFITEHSDMILDYIQNYDESVELNRTDDDRRMSHSIFAFVDAKLNDRLLEKVNNRMCAYVEQKLNIKIQDFWKEKTNITKTLKFSKDFCKIFLNKRVPYVMQITDYVMQSKATSTGYIFYLLAADYYGVELSQEDFDILSNKFDQDPKELGRTFKFSYLVYSCLSTMNKFKKVCS